MRRKGRKRYKKIRSFRSVKKENSRNRSKNKTIADSDERKKRD